MLSKSFRDALTQAQVNKVNILAVLIPTCFMVGYLLNRSMRYDEAQLPYILDN